MTGKEAVKGGRRVPKGGVKNRRVRKWGGKSRPE